MMEAETSLNRRKDRLILKIRDPRIEEETQIQFLVNPLEVTLIPHNNGRDLNQRSNP